MNILKLSFEDYGAVDYDNLLECLHMYECRIAPNCDIKPIILEMAHPVIIQKPKYVPSCFELVIYE